MYSNLYVRTSNLRNLNHISIGMAFRIMWKYSKNMERLYTQFNNTNMNQVQKMNVHIFQIFLPYLLCGFLSIHNVSCGILTAPDLAYNDIDILENDYEKKGK